MRPELFLTGKFNQSLDNVALPSGVQKLDWVGKFNQSLCLPIGGQVASEDESSSTCSASTTDDEEVQNKSHE